MNYTLTILDVSGVQNYLFSSNRMTHNLGASFLVEQAMRAWVDEAADPSQHGEIENGAAWERVYSGGGNAVLLFASHERAVEFTKRYTRHLLENAFGLRVVVQHTDFDWSESLSKVYARAIQKLAEKKSAQPMALPMLGMSVTAACQYTGLPAVDNERDPSGNERRVSADIQAKLVVQDDARKKLKDIFRQELGAYDFTYDFNVMGESGEAFLAIVHADGNGMGKRKEKICERFANVQDNRKFIRALHGFSEQVQVAGHSALCATLKRAIEWDKEKKILFDENNKRVRFVPLVFGGDDVTFVCDGRVGLSLAAIYLQEFNKSQVDGKPLYACAGVAVVKNRYPFARAYDMAEQLCKNAKRAVKQWKIREDEDALALDWHFAVSGAVLDVNEIRKREYTVPDGKLYVRPYFVNAPRNPLQSWNAFRTTVDEFNDGDVWHDKRNKVKELREYLRRGQNAGKQFRELYMSDPKIEFPHIIGVKDCYDSGWEGSTCAYFDAIEAMDLFHDVEKESA